MIFILSVVALKFVVICSQVKDAYRVILIEETCLQSKAMV
ncbi:hypothetical protein ACUXAU_002500 [Staphylococcus caprae]